jgi:hypothetical protein
MPRFLRCTALFMFVAGSLAAQARSDQSRLSFGIALGYNGGTDLWSVRDQKIQTFAIDSADISRLIRPTIGITMIGVYYPNDRVGFTGEAHLIGLGYEDHCHLTTNSGATDNQTICTALNGKQSPGTAVATTVGTIFRPFPWTKMQPYVRGNFGVILSEQSAIRMIATYYSTTDTQNVAQYNVYNEKHPASMTPTGALAFGVAGFIGRAYLLRVEAKDNFVILKTVTGTTQFANREPPWKQHMHQVLSLSVGMEVVLEKRRGRRY